MTDITNKTVRELLTEADEDNWLLRSVREACEVHTERIKRIDAAIARDERLTEKLLNIRGTAMTWQGGIDGLTDWIIEYIGDAP